ncbi:MAG: FmdB family transcriptional regulator [Treponema sp.]|nr:FmdB family transcriptional regulator [Treponema sp.]
MPTYEYECKSCGHNFEVFQSMSEEPLKTCAKCGKEVRRLILGGAGVIFKGSGFYVTDKGTGKSAVAPTAAAAPAAVKTDNKSSAAKNAPPAAVPANPKPTNGDAA